MQFYRPVDEFTVIRSLVPGGPADSTEQLKPEDKIIAVAQGKEDYVDIVGWRLDDVVELIKAKKAQKSDYKSFVVTMLLVAPKKCQ